MKNQNIKEVKKDKINEWMLKIYKVNKNKVFSKRILNSMSYWTTHSFAVFKTVFWAIFLKIDVRNSARLNFDFSSLLCLSKRIGWSEKCLSNLNELSACVVPLSETLMNSLVKDFLWKLGLKVLSFPRFGIKDLGTLWSAEKSILCAAGIKSNGLLAELSLMQLRAAPEDISVLRYPPALSVLLWWMALAWCVWGMPWLRKIFLLIWRGDKSWGELCAVFLKHQFREVDFHRLMIPLKAGMSDPFRVNI